MTAEKIIELKKQTGLTNAEIAERSGLPLITVAKIMSGATKKPRQKTLDLIQRVLVPTYALRDSFTLQNGHTFSLSDPGASSLLSTWGGSCSYQDFCKLPEGTLAELICGRLSYMESPNWAHSSVVDEFSFQIQTQIRQRKGDCIARQGPVDVKLDILSDRPTVLIPDFFILCDCSKISQSGLSGAPDFVLEVLSPSTRRRDIGEKVLLYRDYGVREYWIIDPDTRRLIIYNFMDEKENPIVLPLQGTKGLSIYDNAIKVDLDAINAVT